MNVDGEELPVVTSPLPSQSAMPEEPTSPGSMCFECIIVSLLYFLRKSHFFHLFREETQDRVSGGN